MKKKGLIINLFIILVFSLQMACQDRLIVLWDEGIKPLLVMDSMQIIEGEETIYSESNFTARGFQSEFPVDIIMVIDASGSMSDELTKVKTYVNNLSQTIGNSGFDYRFVMIAPEGNGKNEITVPAPLGTSSRFKHINTVVYSNDAFTKVMECYNSETDSVYDDYSGDECSAYYQNFLRSNALLNIIVISDDNAESPFLLWDGFKSAMSTYVKADFTLHAILGFEKIPGVASVGQEYIDGVDATGGVKCDIATSSNWGILFDQISDNIVQQIIPPTTVYHLNNVPIIFGGSYSEQSLIVSINGNIISHSNNWQYNSSTNSIEFFNSNLIQDGDNINISYALVEGVPP